MKFQLTMSLCLCFVNVLVGILFQDALPPLVLYLFVLQSVGLGELPVLLVFFVTGFSRDSHRRQTSTFNRQVR